MGNNNTLETSKSQGNLPPFNNQSSILQSIHYPQNSHLQSQQHHSQSQQLQQPEMISSFDFSVKHFGLLCDRSFLENSRAFKSQKFGQKTNKLRTSGVRLQPLESHPHQQTHQEQKQLTRPKSGKLAAPALSHLPLRPFSSFIENDAEFDSRNTVRQIAAYEINGQTELILIAFTSLIASNPSDPRARETLNLSTLEYLQQFTVEQQRQLFENDAEFTSVLKSNRKLSKLEFNFTRFEERIRQDRVIANSIEDADANLDTTKYPHEPLTIDFQSTEKLQITFPKIQIYIAQVGYQKQITLSSAQILHLINSKFHSSAMQQFLNEIDVKEFKRLFKVQQEKTFRDVDIDGPENNETEEKEDDQKQEQQSSQDLTQNSKEKQQKSQQRIVLNSIKEINEQPTEHEKKTSTKIEQTPQQSDSPKQSTVVIPPPSQLQIEMVPVELKPKLLPIQQTNETRKSPNFIIDNIQQNRPILELMSLKFYKQSLTPDNSIILSFFPSKISVKQMPTEGQLLPLASPSGSQMITHNLNFQEFYELCGLSVQQDLLNYLSTKLTLTTASQSSSTLHSETDEPRNSSQPMSLSLLPPASPQVQSSSPVSQKINLQLPKIYYDKSDYVVLKPSSEENGLFREISGISNIAGVKYLLRVTPPTFEINYALQNRRQVENVSMAKLNEILKRGFSFAFTLLQ